MNAWFQVKNLVMNGNKTGIFISGYEFRTKKIIGLKTDKQEGFLPRARMLYSSILKYTIPVKEVWLEHPAG